MKRQFLKEYFKRQYSLLVEQEEEEDPFGDDEEETAEEDAEEEGAEEEGAEEEDAEEEPEVVVDEEDEVRFAKSLDDQLQAIFVDIESDAIKSAKVQAESYSLKSLLLKEAEEIDIDIERFASETARIIKNFDSFFNIEQVVLSKMRSFLMDKHGLDIADDVDEILMSRHGISSDTGEAVKEKSEPEVPIAVGAFSGGGA